MITLISGVPGAGKSLYCVTEVLLVLQTQNRKAISEGKAPRRVFVDGIPDLLVEHEPAEDVRKWHEWIPDGSVLVVDEIQRYWRPDNSKSVPEDIAALELHRHRGVDIFIMTQHPMLLNLNVRKLIGKHIHLRRTALGVYVYEWSECVTPDSAWKSAISKLKWSHPKSSFGLYKSASEHQKVKFRIPRVLITLILSVLVFIGAGGYVAYTIYSSVVGSNKSKEQTAQSADKKPQPLVSSSQAQTALVSSSQQLVIDDPVKAFTPRFAGLPESAPAYDPVRKVAVMPVVSGCIADADRCQCITQQGTLVDMPDNVCRERLHHPSFNAYKQPESAPQQPQAVTLQLAKS